MTFSERLNAILGERKISIAQLSEISGVHRNTIGNYVNRKTNPTLPALRALKDGLGCTWDYLLGE